jgi:hypothetical protein
MMKLSLINMYESRFKPEHLPLWTETNAAERRLLDRKQLWDRVAQLDAAIYDVDEPNVDLIYASGESEERMHAIETGMVRTHIDTWERMCALDGSAGQLPEWPRKLYDENTAPSVKEVHENTTSSVGEEYDEDNASPVSENTIAPLTANASIFERRIHQLQTGLQASGIHFKARGMIHLPRKIMHLTTLGQITMSNAFLLKYIENLEEKWASGAELPVWPETDVVVRRYLDRKQLWDRTAQLEGVLADAGVDSWNEPRERTNKGVEALVGTALKQHDEEVRLLRWYIEWLKVRCTLEGKELPEWPRKLYGEGVASKVLGAVKGYFSN